MNTPDDKAENASALVLLGVYGMIGVVLLVPWPSRRLRRISAEDDLRVRGGAAEKSCYSIFIRDEETPR